MPPNDHSLRGGVDNGAGLLRCRTGHLLATVARVDGFVGLAVAGHVWHHIRRRRGPGARRQLPSTAAARHIPDLSGWGGSYAPVPVRFS